MDELTRERYTLLAPADLEAERGDWHWRKTVRTNTPAQVAQRRRDLWRAFGGDKPISMRREARCTTPTAAANTSTEACTPTTSTQTA